MEYLPEGRDENALQRVAFIIQYTDEFPETDFENFDRASKQWKDELPRRSSSNAVRIDSHSQRVSFEEGKIAYLSYEALSKDGSVDFGLRFEDNRILFLVGKYSSWDKIWPQALKHLLKAVGLVSETNQVSSYAVEYTDLFRAKGRYEDFDPSRLLRKGSQYIPEHVFANNENFHFHTGFFASFTDPSPYRVLTRVNADLRDNAEELSRDLSIVLFHTVLPQRDGRVVNTVLPEEILRRGLDNFKTLHSLDKSILKKIVNDEVCSRIGLN